MLEHGAYRLLLDYYYTNGGPIPNDMKAINRACSAHTPTERRAIRKMLETYFEFHTTREHEFESEFWTQKHASREIEKQNKISELRKKAGANAHAKHHANTHTKGTVATATANNHIKLAAEDEVCREEILPSNWHDYAMLKNIPDEQIYSSWRKFKEISSKPWRLKKWIGWVDLERV